MKKIYKTFILLLCFIFLTGCVSTKTNSSKKSIVCTTYAQYNWVQEIIGKDNSAFELTLLIKDGTDLHSYQPTIQDLAKVSSADLFVYVGGESDQWVNDAIKEAKNKKMIAVSMMDVLKKRIKEEAHVEGMAENNEHHHDNEDHDEIEYDEHVWLSLINAQEVISYLSKQIQKLDESNQDEYIYNTQNYLNEIKTLDQQYQKVVQNAHTQTLLFADRFPFRYLLDDYGLNYYAAFPGCSADVEASFYTITFLANKIDELHLNSIFVIDQTNLKIAQTVKENTKEKNQEILYLDSLQSVNDKKISNGYSYLKAMKHNLKMLKKSLDE